MKNKSFYKHYLLMMAPGFLWLIVIYVIPMFGVLMAFEDYSPGLGVMHSQWVGLDNFKYMFSIPDVMIVLRNTVFIAFLKIVGNFFAPLLFALLLNELKNQVIKRTIQTISYLPYFVSWVILSGIMLNIFGYSGPINSLLGLFGVKPILFFAKANLFPYLVAASDVWKGYGFNAIIYLAALAGINPELYEAAAIDGAGRLQRMKHITLPGISVTIAMLAILSLGDILNANFDQIFNLYNPLVYETGDVIDTWVYRYGLLNLQFSLATAVGLIKSLLGFVLIALSYLLADKLTGYRIF